MNNKCISVSIVMPSYNSSNKIRSSINSVINQSYQNWELIIVDGGSKDDTVEIIREFTVNDSRIRLINNPDDMGPADARLQGIKCADKNSKYIAFIDSDDLWGGDKLNTQINIMDSNKYDFTYTYYSLVDDNNIIDKYFFKINDSYNFKQYLGSRGICNSSVVLSKTIFEPSIFEGNLSGFAEDTLWWLLIMRGGIKANLIPHILVYYRKSKNARSTNVWANQVAVWNIYTNILKITPFKALYFYGHYLIDVVIRRLTYSVYKLFK